jgi:hypothetical protein
MPTSQVFKNIITVFRNDVSIFYQRHESTFDLESFHGRFHIIRCLFLAECIYQYYYTKSVILDIEKSFYAILFHDICREDNGVDEWELDSAKECLKYLKNNAFSQEFALQASKIILKLGTKNIEEQILYDVDVLDYNRFFDLPSSKHLFKDYLLKFGGPNDVSGCLDEIARERIIVLAQKLVLFTEHLSVSINTDDLINEVEKYYMEIKPW